MKFLEFMDRNDALTFITVLFVIPAICLIIVLGTVEIFKQNPIKQCYNMCEKSDNIMQCIATCNNVESKERR